MTSRPKKTLNTDASTLLIPPIFRNLHLHSSHTFSIAFHLTLLPRYIRLPVFHLLDLTLNISTTIITLTSWPQPLQHFPPRPLPKHPRHRHHRRHLTYPIRQGQSGCSPPSLTSNPSTWRRATSRKDSKIGLTTGGSTWSWTNGADDGGGVRIL